MRHSYAARGNYMGADFKDIAAGASQILTAGAQVVAAAKGGAMPSVYVPSYSSAPSMGQLATTKTMFGIPLGFVVVGGVVIAGGLFIMLKRGKFRRK